MNNYDVGTAVRCIGKFYSDAAKTTPADPTTVTFRSRRPTGEITIVSGGSVSHDSTGVYHVDVATDTAGIWQYGFQGTGTVAIVLANQFNAEATLFQD